MQKEFINIAAHELRTPIQPILGLTENLLSHAKDTEQAKLLEVVNRNAKRLKRLTEDILDITKIESESLNLKKERFNLNDIVANSIEDMTNNKQFSKVEKNLIKLQYHLPPEIFVDADKGRISQVIHNLLDNAIKFTNVGVISINAQIKNDDEQLVVSVKDAGSGIDLEIMPKLFTKFATKSDTGSGTGLGLGLYISKSIVEAHGGKIWVENNKDVKGSTFYFSLPLRR